MKMGKRATVTIDWLRKGRKVEDLTILRNLLIDYSKWGGLTTKLDKNLFEKSFHLKPIPEKASTEAALNKALGYEEVTEKVTTKMRPLKPSGSTVKEQVKSLFPANLSPRETDTLSYVFSRFVLEDAPKDYDWPLVPEGLDSLSAALFTIHIVSDFIGKSNPWLLPLWSIKVEELRLDGLQDIYNSLLSDKSVDDVLEDTFSIKKTIKEVLIQNPLTDRALAPQDPLSDIIDKWLRSLSMSRALSKKAVDESRRKIASEVLLEINARKGARNTSFDEIDLQRMTLTQWNIHALRPDGPAASEHEAMLKMFRGNINILDYEPLSQICKYLSSSERAGRPVASEVDTLTGTKRRMAHYTLRRLGLILTETYLPTLAKLGLKYRFVFTATKKSSLVSDGLFERMILSESSQKACTVHLEPSKSKGPSIALAPNTIQMIADSELISMSLDLYDKKNGAWILQPWKPAIKSGKKPSSWLFRETKYGKTPPLTPTGRQIDLLGPMWVFRGLRETRMWMLEQLGFVPRTARRYLRNLLEEKVLRLLYTPALEYCGLPEGMLVVGRFKEHSLRESFIDWMISQIPYVHAFTDRSVDMVAYLRLPPYKTDIVGGVIREKLSGGNRKNRITTQSFTARLRSYKTYKMTAFQRIFKENRFTDPWDN